MNKHREEKEKRSPTEQPKKNEGELSLCLNECIKRDIEWLQIVQDEAKKKKGQIIHEG